MQVPIAIPVVGLIAGAAVGLRWPDTPVWLLTGVLCGWVMLAVHGGRASRTALLAVSACGAFSVGGAALAANAWHRAWRPTLRLAFEDMVRQARFEALQAGRLLPEDASAQVVVSGILRQDAALTESGAVSLVVDVDWAGRTRAGGFRDDAATNPVKGRVLLTVPGTIGPDRMLLWRAGRRIRAPSELRRVARYLNPGVPDQERVMARRGVALVGTVKSGALVEVLSRGSFASELAARIRSFTRRSIARGVGPWSPRAAAIVAAIVIGDRTGLKDDVERSLQEAGTYHVLAISGGNIAILAGLLLAAYRLAGMLGRGAMLSAAAVLIAYGFIVGGGASVNRAVLMAVVYFVGRAWDLRGPPAHALTLVAGILVLADPLAVADPSSLLTFGATAAIAAAVPLVPLPSPGPTFPLVLHTTLVAPAVMLVAASAASEVALLPVSAMFFSRVTFAGLILNLGAIPLMAVAQLAGLAVVPLQVVSPTMARAAGWFAYLGAEGLVRSADLVALAPWSTWRVAPPTPLAVVIYYSTVVGAWWLWRLQDSAAPGAEPAPTRRVRQTLALCAFACGAWIAGGGAIGRMHGDGRLHITFIDVGQGDAALVRLPRGSAVLIDAGGLPGAASFDVGDRVVGPVLRHFGVRRLATLALTHGDADHIGGAEAALREFRPWDMWDGVPVPPLEAMNRLRAAATAMRARWTTVHRSDRVEMDGVELRVIHPPIPDWERQEVRNDDSIVIELRWRAVSIVFTGDVGREVEADLSRLLEPSTLRVVKVPHHGSSTSSSDAFLRAVRPDVAVISVGRSNTFGHPAPAVLNRYRAVGAEVFRTDQDGAVNIETDGTRVDVRTFTGRSSVFTPDRQPSSE